MLMASVYLICAVAVSQGCPLSPTLFGLLMDGLHKYPPAQCSSVGPLVGTDPHVCDVALADDVASYSNQSPRGLQALMCAAFAFSQSGGVSISPEKPMCRCVVVAAP